ncbi:MAG TPA: YdcF family protein [Aggregatilineales bacterium]|nr:YdcF family protein [Aggregatilineales bacterium]
MLLTRRRFVRLRRWLARWLAIVFLILFLAASAFAVFVYAYGGTDRAQPADVIIILGAGTNADGTPTMPQIRRVRHGVALYQKGLAPRLLCTGGFTREHPVSEAATCVALARAGGVPESAILREDVSTTTQENAIEARTVMTAHDLHTAILVSDRAHLFRAEWLFHHYGMDVFVSPAQATQGPLPIFEAVTGSYYESGAIVWDRFRILVGMTH